ncbi:four-helix bundle copper-binding protein [Cellvibrio sp.]|uniref:four-helix bundle copper-binding protein n=1 Tax=Cellvibrio sp. TaxID=1965322 RepID=UPI003964834E
MVTNEHSNCLENCTRCHQVCLKTAMTHCLNMGGEHVAPDHFKLMMDCAKICATSAVFQLGGSQFSAQICAVCAKICEACARSCEQVGDMEECVAACKQCAESCAAMAA